MHRLTAIVLLHRKTSAISLLAFTALMAVGASRVETVFGSRVLLGDQHPAIQRLDELTETFGGGVPLYIAWECGPGRPCESVFDAPSLQMAQAVSSSLESSSGVSKIYSPTNAPLFLNTPEGFSVRRLVENGVIAKDHDELARLAARDPLWVGNLISADSRVGAIVVQTTASRADVDALVVDAVLDNLEPYREFDFKLVGEAFGNIIGGRELAQSTANLIPFMVLVIAAVIFAQTRSWQAVLVTLVSMGTALLWTFGMLGWLSWPQDSILETLAPLIVIIGICDAIHLLAEQAALERSPASGDRPTRIIEAARRISGPCLLTTATTAAAFASFATSDLDTFQRFGIISAVGAVACLIATFSLLPLLAIALPPEGERSLSATNSWEAALKSLADTTVRRRMPILSVAAVILGVCLVGWIGFLRVDTSRQELFGEKSRILQWVRFFEDRLRPSFTVELTTTLPSGTTADSPEVVAALVRFSEQISKHEFVGSAWSFERVLSSTRRAVYGEEPKQPRASTTRAANAELLELVAFEDPGYLRTWLTPDRSQFRISVDVTEQNYSNALALLQAIEEAESTSFADDWTTELSGSLPLAFDWVTDVQSTQTRSFPVALALVSVFLLFRFRSIALAVSGLLPAVIPVVAILGVMGFAGMSLDVGKAMLGAVVIGIAVDDCIHLLYRYRDSRNAGAPPVDSIKSAVVQAGRPITSTSIALALGFLTLSFSAWGTISSFGFFVSIAMLGALAATLLVLPALLSFSAVRE